MGEYINFNILSTRIVLKMCDKYKLGKISKRSFNIYIPEKYSKNLGWINNLTSSSFLTY